MCIRDRFTVVQMLYLPIMVLTMSGLGCTYHDSPYYLKGGAAASSFATFDSLYPHECDPVSESDGHHEI